MLQVLAQLTTNTTDMSTRLLTDSCNCSNLDEGVCDSRYVCGVGYYELTIALVAVTAFIVLVLGWYGADLQDKVDAVKEEGTRRAELPPPTAFSVVKGTLQKRQYQRYLKHKNDATSKCWYERCQGKGCFPVCIKPQGAETAPRGNEMPVQAGTAPSAAAAAASSPSSGSAVAVERSVSVFQHHQPAMDVPHQPQHDQDNQTTLLKTRSTAAPAANTKPSMVTFRQQIEALNHVELRRKFLELRAEQYIHAIGATAVFLVLALFTPPVSTCLLPPCKVPAVVQSCVPLLVSFAVSAFLVVKHKFVFKTVQHVDSWWFKDDATHGYPLLSKASEIQCLWSNC